MENGNSIASWSIRRIMRVMNVIVVYEYELFNIPLNTKEIFEEDKLNNLFNYQELKIKNKNSILNEQMQLLSVIEKNYLKFKEMITKFIRDDWTWTRINPLTRAILLCAAVEVWKLDIGIVTNEYVEIAKEFIPDDESYKFINVVIEKIGKMYHEFKQEKIEIN